MQGHKNILADIQKVEHMLTPLKQEPPPFKGSANGDFLSVAWTLFCIPSLHGQLDKNVSPLSSQKNQVFIDFIPQTDPWSATAWQWLIIRFADSSQAVSKPVWHIPLLCVQWKTPVDGQRNCPKHAEFYSKNTFQKLVHLVDFIIQIHALKFKHQSGHLDSNESLNKLIVTHATVEEWGKLNHQPCGLIPDLLETVKNGQNPR